MVLWIKIALVAAGLLITSATHFLWKGNATEQVVDTVVEQAVDSMSGVDIGDLQHEMDDVVDLFEKIDNKN